MEEIRNNIYELVAEEFAIPPEQINDDLGPEELAVWSSLRHFQLMRIIEEEFDILFLPDEIMLINSIKDIVEIVEKKIKNES